MALREGLGYILDNYLIASRESFKGHAIANFLRHGLPDTVVGGLADNGRFIVKGSAGQGAWAKGPWVAVFDPLVTTTPQTGYYPVYLFREDMEGVYLSLNQGMTEAKRLYKSDAKTALRARAANYRAILGTQNAGRFTDVEIDLASSGRGNDTSFYEAANVCARFYPADRLPTEYQLLDDLAAMLLLYNDLLEAETSVSTGDSVDGDEPAQLLYEDASKFRLHKRIERNAKLVAHVKSAQGYTCKVCGTDFEKTYGIIGKGYIEAHHLKPIALLKGAKVALDPRKDFAVLCSNCHRMVHRSGSIDNIEKFKEDHYQLFGKST